MKRLSVFKVLSVILVDNIVLKEVGVETGLLEQIVMVVVLSG